MCIKFELGSCDYRGRSHQPWPAHLWRTQFCKSTFFFFKVVTFLIQRQYIQQMHRDHVPSLPPSFHLLGSTTQTKNQGMVQFSDPDARIPMPGGLIPQIHVLTLQGHPEFNAGFMKQLIGEWGERGVMDKDTVEDGLNRADERNDGVNIAKVIWEVLLR